MILNPYRYVTGGGSCTWATTYTSAGSGTSSGDFSAYTLRNVIGTAALAAGSKVRITFQAGSVGLIIEEAYIQTVGATAPAYSGTPIQMLFGGSTGITVAAGVDVTCDDVTLTVSGSVALVTGMWTTSPSSIQSYAEGSVDGYFHIGNSASDVPALGYGDDSVQSIKRVEVCGSSVISTWNPADVGDTIVLSNGDLTIGRTGGSSLQSTRSTTSIAATASGYYEVLIDSTGASNFMLFGVATSSADVFNFVGHDAYGWGYYQQTGEKYTSNTGTAYGATYTDGDVIGVAFNNGKVWFAKNNTYQNSGDPVADTGEAYSGLTGNLFAMASLYNSGNQVTGRFKTADFSYSPPTGFNAWEMDGGGTSILWNSADKSADITLSESDKRATKSTPGAWAMVRSATSCTIGGGADLMFEVEVLGDTQVVVGFAASTELLSNFVGRSANGYGFYASNGNKMNNNIGAGYGSAISVGDKVRCIITSAGTVKFFVNGVSQGIAFTGLAGTFYPAFSGFNSSPASSGRAT